MKQAKTSKKRAPGLGGWRARRASPARERMNIVNQLPRGGSMQKNKASSRAKNFKKTPSNILAFFYGISEILRAPSISEFNGLMSRVKTFRPGV
jgi:hypothetical protein